MTPRLQTPPQNQRYSLSRRAAAVGVRAGLVLWALSDLVGQLDYAPADGELHQLRLGVNVEFPHETSPTTRDSASKKYFKNLFWT